MSIARVACHAAVLSTLILPQAAHASFVQVATRAALNANLNFQWTTFGPVGSLLEVYQQESIGPEVVDINSSSGVLYVSQQGNGFTGDFTNGDVVLLQPNPDDGQVIGFSSPVLAFGTNIDPISSTGPFTAYAAAYDSSNTLIGLAMVTGTSTDTGAGTAPFIGFTSYSDPIAYVNFGLVEPNDPAVSRGKLDGIAVLGNIALDGVSVVVPEPSSLALLTAALGLFAGGIAFGRNRRA